MPSITVDNSVPHRNFGKRFRFLFHFKETVTLTNCDKNLYLDLLNLLVKMFFFFKLNNSIVFIKTITIKQVYVKDITFLMMLAVHLKTCRPKKRKSRPEFIGLVAIELRSS